LRPPSPLPDSRPPEGPSGLQATRVAHHTTSSHAVSCIRRSAAARPDRSEPDRAGIVLGRCAQGGVPGRPAPRRHHQGSGLDPARARRGRRRCPPGGRRPRRRVHDARDLGRAVRPLVPRPRSPGPWHRPGTRVHRSRAGAWCSRARRRPAHASRIRGARKACKPLVQSWPTSSKVRPSSPT
jgi:hypothetical protein